MASPGSSARLFVALDLPDAAREALVDWRARVFAGKGYLRLVDPAALHVTLAFLGSRAEEQIPAIASVVRAATADRAQPVLAAVGVRSVPQRNPRLFALDLTDKDDRAGQIHTALAAALERGGFYSREERPFWPHVTLARVARGVQTAGFEGLEPPGDPWGAAGVTLYRSHLSPKGARYEALETVRLVP